MRLLDSLIVTLNGSQYFIHSRIHIQNFPENFNDVAMWMNGEITYVSGIINSCTIGCCPQTETFHSARAFNGRDITLTERRLYSVGFNLASLIQ